MAELLSVNVHAAQSMVQFNPDPKVRRSVVFDGRTDNEDLPMHSVHSGTRESLRTYSRVCEYLVFGLNFGVCDVLTD